MAKTFHQFQILISLISLGGWIGITPALHAEAPIRQGDRLSVGRCVEIALQQQPSVHSALGTIKVYESKKGQAQANYYPQINWSTVYNRYAPEQTDLNVLGGSLDKYSTVVGLTQNLYDFEKTATKVRLQDRYVDASQADLANVTNQVVYAVKAAYLGLLQADQNRQAAAETVKQFEEQLRRAQGFFAAGKRPKFDVTKAEVDLSNARLNLLKLENIQAVAFIQLCNAMGLPDAPFFQIIDYPADYPADNPAEETCEALLQTAYDRRPDLRSAQARREASETAIALEKKNYYPYLTGNAQLGWTGDSLPLSNNWNVGAVLTFPLFTGFSTRYAVEEARANLEVTSATEKNLRQTVSLEVRQTCLNVREAAKRIPTAALTLRQATENFELAQGRYQSGVGNPIEVTDALTTLATAQTVHINARYEYYFAQAALEKAMGGTR